MSENNNNQPKNLYELEGMSTFKSNWYNPNFEKHHIGPNPYWKMMVIGGSGISRKTSGTLNFIMEFWSGTYDGIHLFLAEREPLYDWFTSQLPPGSWTMSVGEIPSVKEFYKNKEEGTSHLLIFDDQMNHSANMKIILNYFLYARKLPKKGGSSLIFICQSPTGMASSVGRTLRQQMSMFMIKRINSLSVIGMLADEFKFGKTKEEMLQMYNYCNADSPDNWLLINLEARNPDEIFRKNYYEFL